MSSEADGVDMPLVVDHVAEYRRLADQINALEKDKEEKREAVCELLQTAGSKVGAKWEFPSVGIVRVTQGRTTARLNRMKLARLGVSTEILDAATETTEGPNVVRIEGWKDEGEE